MTSQDLAMLRRTILRVIDEGRPDGCEWYFYAARDDQESFANEQRLDFCDTVQKAITEELQAERRAA